MVTLITILHVLVCGFLILVVLLQAGKGGGMGLAFGSSGAQSVFGGSGAGNFLTKLTAGTAIMFMLTSLSLAYFASARESSWLDDYERDMANQLNREREQREKLSAATARDGGTAAVDEGGAVPAETTEGATPVVPPADPAAPPADPAAPRADPAAAPAPGQPTEPVPPPPVVPPPVPNPPTR